MSQDGKIRKLFLLLASFLVIYALVGLLHQFGFLTSSRLERVLCHFGFCGDDTLRDMGDQLTSRGDEASLKEAVDIFEQALRMDPASAYRWCDLAETLLKANQTSRAGYCMSEALKHAPQVAIIQLRAGLFYFEAGQIRDGLHCMSRVLELSDEYDANVFATYAGKAGGVDNVLTDGLPALQRPAQSYFRHLLDQEEEIPDLRKVWQWLIAHSFTDDKLASDYIDFLLGSEQYQTAAEAWTQQLGGRKGDYRQSNELFNGGFEAEPTGTVLDWRIRKVEGVEVKRDSTQVVEGRWSLRISFGGKENVNYSIAQRAVVKPGPYRFAAWIRTEGITTDQGIGWQIVDAEASSRLNVSTEQRLGTSDWSQVEATFNVLAETDLLEVRLSRRASRKFDNKISGTVWVDKVSLTPQ
jgi:hypothetical protein